MGKSGYTCIRRTFCWLNILLWICGSLFLALGIWLKLSYQGYATLLPNHIFLSADTIFIIIGVLSFVVTFFGCCGSWFESRCCLILYFSAIILLFLSEFLVGSLAFVFRGGLGRVLANELQYGIEHHYNVTDRGPLGAPSVAAIWDNFQMEFQCCGVISHEDWYDIKSWPGERWVPQSCCRPIYNSTYELQSAGAKKRNEECAKSHNPKLWWSKGCAKALQIWLMQRLHIVGSIGLVIAFMQLFGLITSMLLFCTMRHNESSQTYKSYSPAATEPNSRHMTESYMNDL